MALTVRPMKNTDLDAVSRLGAELVRLHHRYDPRRFFTTDDPQGGYKWFLGTQMKNADVVLLVAELDGEIAGYLYGSLEERDWARLVDAHGAINDVYVDERYRRRGVARALVNGGVAALEEKGAKRVLLSSAWPNTEAQALFEACGFRRTMVEMTRG
jgi:ribosomal protein S18 acetylase RimI-like enzyme